jgi:hypothetical protein
VDRYRAGRFIHHVQWQHLHIRESFVTGVIGLAFLVSLILPKSLGYVAPGDSPAHEWRNKVGRNSQLGEKYASLRKKA